MPMPQPFDGWTKDDFISRIDEMQRMNYSLYKDNKRLDEAYKLNENDVPRPKNERGAGRKPRLTKQIYSHIIFYHKKGHSIRQIIHCLENLQGIRLSVGLVHKAISLPSGEGLE